MIDICEIFQVLMEPKQCCIYTVLEDNISRKYLLSLLAKHGIPIDNQELVRLKALITAEIGTLHRIINANSSTNNQEVVHLKSLITAAFTAINSEKDNIRGNQEKIGTLQALARYSIERPITTQMSFDMFKDLAPPAIIWRNSKLVGLYMHLNSQADFTCNVTVYFLQPVSVSIGSSLEERVLIDKRIDISHFSNSYFLTNDTKADVEIEMGRTLKVAFNNIYGGGYDPHVKDPHSCLIQYILE